MISINSVSFNNWTAIVNCASEQNLNLSHQLNMNKWQVHLKVHLGEVWVQTASGNNWKLVPLLSSHPLFTVTTRTLTLSKLMLYQLYYIKETDIYIYIYSPANSNTIRSIHWLLDKGTSSHICILPIVLFFGLFHIMIYILWLFV